VPLQDNSLVVRVYLDIGLIFGDILPYLEVSKYIVSHAIISGDILHCLEISQYTLEFLYFS
jgi:hypothetical protein